MGFCAKQLGVKPICVSIVNEYESVLEFSAKVSITTIAQALKRLKNWAPPGKG